MSDYPDTTRASIGEMTMLECVKSRQCTARDFVPCYRCETRCRMNVNISLSKQQRAVRLPVEDCSFI